jgi:hypothetical protein
MKFQILACNQHDLLSGLDPAGPLFYKFDPAVRIDSQDAVFVDIIHTDGTREYYIQIYPVS